MAKRQCSWQPAGSVGVALAWAGRAEAALLVEPQFKVYMHIQHTQSMSPCIEGGVLTVATCAHLARAHGKVGDWLMLWWIADERCGNMLATMLRIDSVLEPSVYYGPMRESDKRNDMFYRWVDGVGIVHTTKTGHGAPCTYHNRAGASEVAKQRAADARGRVLLSRRFWHGGHVNIQRLPSQFASLQIGQRQRMTARYHSQGTVEELFTYLRTTGS